MKFLSLSLSRYWKSIVTLSEGVCGNLVDLGNSGLVAASTASVVLCRS